MKKASKDRSQLVMELRERLLGNLAENTTIIELLEILDPDNMHTLPLQEQPTSVAEAPAPKKTHKKVGGKRSTTRRSSETPAREMMLAHIQQMGDSETITNQQLAEIANVSKKTAGVLLKQAALAGMFTREMKQDGGRGGRYFVYTKKPITHKTEITVGKEKMTLMPSSFSPTDEELGQLGQLGSERGDIAHAES